MQLEKMSYEISSDEPAVLLSMMELKSKKNYNKINNNNKIKQK